MADSNTLEEHVLASLRHWIEEEAEQVLDEARHRLENRIRKRVGQFAVDLARTVEIERFGQTLTIRLRDETRRDGE